MHFREAVEEDLDQIVALLADDPIGKKREDYRTPLPTAYLTAFVDIQAQSGNTVIVATGANDEIMGCLQLTLIPGLSRRGMKRGLIEGVRVHRDFRGQAIGQRLISYAIDLAREAGCGLVLLTTDKRRPDAREFYLKLGFEESHIGMKYKLQV